MTRFRLAVSFVFASTLLTLASARSPKLSTLYVAPDDARISFSGFVSKSLVDANRGGGKAIRFDRKFDMPGTGYRWDNPGVTIHFRTNASHVSVLLEYNDKHISTTQRNSVGFWTINKQAKSTWHFRSVQTETTRSTETLIVRPQPPHPGFHDYAITLPYGDSVDFAGLEVNEEAKFKSVTCVPAFRCVIFGDSITQGFTATSVEKTYAYLLGEKNKWQVINFGLAGRSSPLSDEEAKAVTELAPDCLIVLIGGNDWQGGRPLSVFESNVRQFLSIVTREKAETPIFFITPLWVAPAWNPPKQIADLEEYRRVIRTVALEFVDENVHLIEGPSLIDHDISYFDKVLVHPNDAGFAMMASRLAAQISPKIAPSKKLGSSNPKNR